VFFSPRLQCPPWTFPTRKRLYSSSTPELNGKQNAWYRYAVYSTGMWVDLLWRGKTSGNAGEREAIKQAVTWESVTAEGVLRMITRYCCCWCPERGKPRDEMYRIPSGNSCFFTLVLSPPLGEESDFGASARPMEGKKNARASAFSRWGGGGHSQVSFSSTSVTSPKFPWFHRLCKYVSVEP
jgi:hypothetical protein